MRTIQKTISLEPMTSRLPSVWPAYKDNVLYFFDKESLKRRKQEYPCNYGMIPMSFVSGETEYSFTTLSNLYHFYRDYKHLCNNLGHCNRAYSSATDYYDSEIDTRYSRELEYGLNRDVYVEMDEKYQQYSGLCDYICANIVPSYMIPSAYTEYWKTDILYYPDVIKWIAWFDERKDYESTSTYTSKTGTDIEHWNCKDSSNCCDCEEFFKRGGKRTLSSMTKWYEDIQSKILSNKTTNTVEPQMICEVELQNSSENMGQYSLLSPDYELGVDYRGANGYDASTNTKSGTTVIDDSGNTMILSSSGQGFCFSPSYMEKIYDEDAWSSYTEVYMEENKNDFVSSAYSYYAFDDDNKMYTGNTSDEVEDAMKSGAIYDIIYIDAILINSTLFPIEESEYGYYDVSNPILSGRTYFVYREKDTSTPYTLINGKKVYAETYLSTSGLCYYFSFFKNSAYTETNGCHEEPKAFDINRYQIFGKYSSDNKIKYIVYNGKTYIIGECINNNDDNDDDEECTCNCIKIIDDTSITIDSITYPRIKGYTYDKYGNIIYVLSDNDKICDADLNELSSTTYRLDGDKIYVNTYNKNVIIYQSKELTGYTISKLSDLMAVNKLVDDTGNDIDGIYDETCIKINSNAPYSSSTYAQPPYGTVLEPLYQLGNTSLISRFKLTNDKESEVENYTNYFVGNIISSMKFYYKDIYGNRTSASAQCGDNVSSLSAITSATTIKDRDNNTIFDDNLYCDIQYNIGATLQRKKDEPFKLADDVRNVYNIIIKHFNHGVEYSETVRFVKTPTFYKLKIEPEDKDVMPTEQFDAVNLPHKYTIYAYKMEQDMSTITNDVYETLYEAPLAKFKSEINLIDSNLTPNFSAYTDMEDYDGINVSPVFKEEYRLGIAAKENLDTDIYIDRGINAAFERHLKLGEVTSMNTLLDMGNGYFKIMED